MAEKPETGHVGAGAGPILQQASGCGSRRLHHRRNRGLDQTRRGEPARRRSQDHASAERLGQDQAVAGTQPGLAQQLSWPRPPGHGKSEREFGALGAVPTD